MTQHARLCVPYISYFSGIKSTTGLSATTMKLPYLSSSKAGLRNRKFVFTKPLYSQRRHMTELGGETDR